MADTGDASNGYERVADMFIARRGTPNIVAAFRERFPDVEIECNTVEQSDFFGRKFDGVIAWGLMFLLMPDAQAIVIERVGRVLEPGGGSSSPRRPSRSHTTTSRRSASGRAPSSRPASLLTFPRRIVS